MKRAFKGLAPRSKTIAHNEMGNLQASTQHFLQLCRPALFALLALHLCLVLLRWVGAAYAMSALSTVLIICALQGLFAFQQFQGRSTFGLAGFLSVLKAKLMTGAKPPTPDPRDCELVCTHILSSGQFYRAIVSHLVLGAAGSCLFFVTPVAGHNGADLVFLLTLMTWASLGWLLRVTQHKSSSLTCRRTAYSYVTYQWACALWSLLVAGWVAFVTLKLHVLGGYESNRLVVGLPVLSTCLAQIALMVIAWVASLECDARACSCDSTAAASAVPVLSDLLFTTPVLDAVIVLLWHSAVVVLMHAWMPRSVGLLTSLSKPGTSSMLFLEATTQLLATPLPAPKKETENEGANAADVAVAVNEWSVLQKGWRAWTLLLVWATVSVFAVEEGWTYMIHIFFGLYVLIGVIGAYLSRSGLTKLLAFAPALASFNKVL